MPKRHVFPFCHLPLCLVLFSANALAQNPELGDVNRQPPPPARERAADPFPARAPAPLVYSTGATDHSLVVGHFGVGFFGVAGLPVMGCGADGVTTGATCDPNTTYITSAPTIGARWWMDEFMALEAAIGIGYHNGGSTARTGGTSADADEPGYFGLALHGGLPLVFATAAHFAFMVVPEINVGFVTGGWDSPSGNNDADLSGFLLELGARVGAEIQFGFIDIPQLALQGSVGLRMRYEGRNISVGNNEFSSHRFNLETTVNGEPWDIFTGNITAIYYF
jgi:hypothetical protein